MREKLLDSQVLRIIFLFDGMLNHAGTDIDASHSQSGISLSSAAQNGRLDIVEVLLRAGADPHSLDKCGNTPLHLASLFLHYRIVELLLAAGSNVNALNDGKQSSLWLACRNLSPSSDYPVVKLLLAVGADPNCRANDDTLPIDGINPTDFPDLVQLFHSLPLPLLTLCRIKIHLQEIKSNLQI